MRVQLLLTQDRSGAVDCEQAFTESQMENMGDVWAEQVVAAREEVGASPTNLLGSIAFGVVTVDIPDGDIVDAFDRAERAPR